MITVITPFSRPANIQAMLDMLKGQGVRWIPVCHEAKHFYAFKDMCLPWIRPLMWHDMPIPTKHSRHLDACYAKINSVIERRGQLNDSDRLHFLCDDDGIPPNFYREVERSQADVVFVSLDRGDNAEKGDNGFKHNAGIQRPTAFGRCQVGLEQYIVRYKVARQLRHDEYDPAADGGYSAYLWHMREHGFGWTVDVRPDLVAYLNFLQPGRFNDRRAWA